MNLVELNHLSFHYKKINIFQDTQLSIKKNQLNCLIGASGSGKSTLLYILFLLLKPQKGKYYFENKTIEFNTFWNLSRFRKKNISLLFQDFRLLPFLTVAENIKFPLFFVGKKFDKYHFNTLVQKLGIEHKLKEYPYTLSGGESQRVAFARALMSQPKLVLLDEPTGNLDLKSEKNILMLINQFKTEFTFFCVTHSKNIYNKADILYEIKNKKIISKK